MATPVPDDPAAHHPAPAVRNPRREAAERVGPAYEVRVLEPSPPAVSEEPWFADDPVDVGDRDPTRRLVSPVTNGDLLWDELARDDRSLARWCAERWLGAFAPLKEPGPALADTRSALHQLAEHVISPTRQRANGKVGLRYTRGGFGTPFFGNDVQVRVEGDVLVLQLRDRVHSGRLTSLADAAEFIGFDLTRFDLEQAAQPLPVDAEASRWLGDWFGLAASALEQLRVEAQPEDEPGRVQLWPEHFDLAVELGPDSGRATFGFSPGDESHPQPYVYVSPWGSVPDTEPWTARGFAGAQLGLPSLLASEDQREAALRFLRDRRAELRAAAVTGP